MASRNIAAHGSATVIEKRTEILNPALIFSYNTSYRAVFQRVQHDFSALSVWMWSDCHVICQRYINQRPVVNTFNYLLYQSKDCSLHLRGIFIELLLQWQYSSFFLILASAFLSSIFCQEIFSPRQSRGRRMRSCLRDGDGERRHKSVYMALYRGVFGLQRGVRSYVCQYFVAGAFPFPFLVLFFPFPVTPSSPYVRWHAVRCITYSRLSLRLSHNTYTCIWPI